MRSPILWGQHGCFSIRGTDTGVAIPTATVADGSSRWANLARRARMSKHPPPHAMRCCFGDSNAKNNPGAFSFW